MAEGQKQQSETATPPQSTTPEAIKQQTAPEIKEDLPDTPQDLNKQTKQTAQKITTGAQKRLDVLASLGKE